MTPLEEAARAVVAAYRGTDLSLRPYIGPDDKLDYQAYERERRRRGAALDEAMNALEALLPEPGK
jgi:hypothetical protein